MPGRDSIVFPLVPKRRLSGLPFGLARSRRRGRGTDVAGARAYVPGDPVSSIDWRASARLSTARDVDEFVVRERFADEAPRVVVLCDRRPSMALYAPPFPWLSKPAAVHAAVDGIVASAIASRGPVGYLDYGDAGEPYWLPPRGRTEWERIGDRQREEEEFHAPPDTLAIGLGFLGGRRHEIPSGSFVFVVSDYLEPPSREAWLTAAAHGWDVVPVVVQDPLWEQSFPRIDGVVVPLVDPRDGRVLEVRLSRLDAAERRRANEAARSALVETFVDLGFDAVWLDDDDAGRIGLAFLEWAERRREARVRR